MIIKRVLPRRLKEWIKEKVIPYQEIHVEKIEKTYPKLCGWVKKRPNVMLMLTFSNEPDYEIEKIVFYEKLVHKFSNPIGLHVHISGGLNSSPPPPLQDYKTQLFIIKHGLNMLRELGVETIDFTSGNWNYNYDTFMVCKELGLRRVHIKLKEIPRIVFEYGCPKGIELVPVVRHIHDYEL